MLMILIMISISIIIIDRIVILMDTTKVSETGNKWAPKGEARMRLLKSRWSPQSSANITFPTAHHLSQRPQPARRRRPQRDACESFACEEGEDDGRRKEGDIGRRGAVDVEHDRHRVFKHAQGPGVPVTIGVALRCNHGVARQDKAGSGNAAT